jgi:arylsulfatase A-like enzyme
LPLNAPKKYWDLHPPESVELTSFPDLPSGAPPIAGHDSFELRAYEDVPDEGELSEELQLRLIRGYRACVSYVDAQVGRLVEALREEGIEDETIILLWGDHGWHLGELGMWGKFTNYENATRAPLIVYVPGMERTGVFCDRLVEFVDVYPTLAQLCGLSVPKRLEGTSFVPLLENPEREWKTAVFHLFPRLDPERGQLMGYAMRTPTHRIIEWIGRRGQSRAIEVYAYADGLVEQVNLAEDEENAKMVTELLGQLHGGWKDALPK